MTQVSIAVADGGPASLSDSEDEEQGEEPPPVESWVLYVQCRGGSLAEVMRAVTASPLQSITFDAAEVRFQGGVGPGEGGAAAAAAAAAGRRHGSGGGPPTITSLEMQEYIEAEWSEHWRGG